MRRHLPLLTILIVVAASLKGYAGTLEGKVSPGDSVVYVDTIPGKTFPAPAQSQVVRQRGLKFLPHLLAVQQGTTVDFQNDDTVQHNVFWLGAWMFIDGFVLLACLLLYRVRLWQNHPTYRARARE